MTYSPTLSGVIDLDHRTLQIHRGRVKCLLIEWEIQILCKILEMTKYSMKPMSVKHTKDRHRVFYDQMNDRYQL